MKPILKLASIIIPAALVATTPAISHERNTVHSDANIVVRGNLLPPAPNNDTNSFWLDYTTDVSEANRELQSDLARATDAEDRREAYAEHRSEIRDAQKDYAEEMSERGYRVASFEADNGTALSLR